MELTPIEPGQVVNIPLAQIEPDPDQPRRVFDEDALAQLADDIRQRGVQEPIKIRKSVIPSDPYTIKTGERRWRASQLAGKRKIPCILAGPEVLLDENSKPGIERLFDQVKENHLREELGPLDWAFVFRRLRNDYGLKVHEIVELCAARGLKLSRPHISNIMRLTELPDWAQDALRARRITGGHGKVLFAALHSPAVEAEIRAQIENPAGEPLSVRELEQAIRHAYVSNHRRAWEVVHDDTLADLRDNLAESGLVEFSDSAGGTNLFVIDQEKYDAAIAAREQALDDNENTPSQAREAEGQDEGGDENTATAAGNPRWLRDGTINGYVKDALITQSIETWLASEIEARFDYLDQLRLGAWLAYGLPALDYQGRIDGERHQDSLWRVCEVITNETPTNLPLSWEQWRKAGQSAVIALVEAAGGYLIRSADLTLLLELAGTPRPDINDYRCNAAWFESLDRDGFNLVLDRLSDVVPPGDIPDDFESCIELLEQHAEIFGVPDAVVDRWAALTVEQLL